jgi:mRNA interferase MazF
VRITAISSVVRGTVAPTDFAIDSTHPEFAQTSPRVTSVIRLHKLVTVERTLIRRRLGRIGPQLQAEVDRLLRMVLGL